MQQQPKNFSKLEKEQDIFKARHGRSKKRKENSKIKQNLSKHETMLVYRR